MNERETGKNVYGGCLAVFENEFYLQVKSLLSREISFSKQDLKMCLQISFMDLYLQKQMLLD